MMKKRLFRDPYAEIIDRFNRGGVRYVVVGMSGINYYASDARETFSTQDFDIFVKPAISNIKKALTICRDLGYSAAADAQEVADRSIENIAKKRHTVIITDPYGITIDLILAVSGYAFGQMEFDASVFDIGGIPVRVARLKKLLMSKKIAGREKDRLFLKRFEALLKEKK